MKPTLKHAFMDSPLGPLTLVSSPAGLSSLRFGTIQPAGSRCDRAVHARVIRLLERYFRGEPTGFDIPLDPVGTDFERRVWDRLRRIPWGETRTYGQIATEIGQPRAARAVGRANNRNPIAIVIPCHRVIGSNGSLTGYAAGLDIKSRLLSLEGRKSDTQRSIAFTERTATSHSRGRVTAPLAVV